MVEVNDSNLLNCILPIELVTDILYKYGGLEHPLAKIIKNINEIILSNSYDNKFYLPFNIIYENKHIDRMPRLIPIY